MLRKVAAVLLMVVAGALIRPASAQTELNIIQPVLRSMLFWPIHVGEMLGYFEEEGVSLQLIATDPNIPYTVFLVSGNADIVLLDSPQVLQALNAGYEVASIYTVHDAIPQGVFVAEESPIYSVADLEGFRVGLGSNRDLASLQVALAHEGAPLDGIETVVVGDSGPILTGVFTKDFADAYVGSLASVAPLAAHGIALRDITPKSVKSAPTNSFVVQKSRVEELREPICGFLRAWSKAVHIGKQDIEYIAAMSRHPDGVPEVWENEDYGYHYLHAIADFVIPEGGTYGELEPKRWQAMLDDLLLIGELEIEHDVNEVLDRSFAACANDFDPDEVMVEAEAWMRDPANAEYVREYH